ncbi:MAG: copper chaperone PCu(A)C [Hyphomicrobiales bacterium]|nr:copper chaperone PCu(A)C [Hyphomicrobiales bacterium]
MYAGVNDRGAIIAALYIAIAFLCAQTAYAGEHGITVSDAWVRMAPPVLKTHGGFLTLTNDGEESKELIGATSKNYGEVQIHLSKIIDGVSTMQRMESVEVAAGKTVEFKHGGLHLMLMSAKIPLEEGSTVPIMLNFRSGETVHVEAMVMTMAPGGGQMEEMDHSGHDGHHTH